MQTDGKLRILKLEAENFKRIEAVEIEPGKDGGLVVIAGKNAQGKSSVLDAITAAFCGARKIPEMVLREGTDEGFVRVDVGDYIVERTFKLKPDGKPASSKLEVRAADGAKYQSPQELLDAAVGKISFDPLSFMRSAPKNQAAELVKVADLKLDLEEWARRRAGVFESRTDINRDAKKLEARAETMLKHKDIPAEVKPFTVVAEELRAAQARNVDREAIRDSVDRIERDLAAAAERKAELEGKLKTWRAKREADEDTAPLELALAEAESISVKVNENAARDDVLAEFAAAKETAAEFTAELDKLDKTRVDALAAAKLPVPGLSVKAEGISYNGVPFDQCALSEQLMISTAIAMSANPKLRVILIRDGSLLDVDGRAALEKLAKDRGYQVWFECVGGDIGFVIEAGRIKKAAK